MSNSAGLANGHLLEVDDLAVHFAVREGDKRRAELRAVDSISFEVRRGETLALVGESGSGKSTVARAVVRVEDATAGTIRWMGQDITRAKGHYLRHVRRDLQMVFQDPYSSLNRRHTVGRAVAEPLRNLSAMGRRDRQVSVAAVLERVGLDRSFMGRYPHTLSGGQRQRVAIARALVIEPALVVCDESVSALDVSVQAQIMNLLSELREERDLAYLFIAHDLAVVRHIADRVAVMYCGKIVEVANASQVYEEPLHPYTQSLLSAAPIPDVKVERGRQRIVLKGELPSPIRPPSGCRFRTRCPWARTECAETEPILRFATPGHSVACHFYEEIAGGTSSSDG